CLGFKVWWHVGLEFPSGVRTIAAFYARRGGRRYFAVGVFYLIPALAAGRQRGNSASAVRISDVDLSAHRDGNIKCRSLRRGVGGGRSRPHVASHPIPESTARVDIESPASALSRGHRDLFEESR